MIVETFRLALTALNRNALRSFLTVLGIVIGVAAVIAMVMIGQGASAKVAADIAKLGVNLLIVRPGQFGPGRASATARPFTERDLDAVESQIRNLRAVAPASQLAVTVVRGTDNYKTVATGTDNRFFITQNWALSAGRQFQDGEIRGGGAACILGETVRRQLFGLGNPIGQAVRVQHMSCQVVGLLEAKGQSSFGSDQDDILLMPLRTFHRRIAGRVDIATLIISANEEAETEKVQRDVELLLRERRHIGVGKDDDFTVRDMKQLAETMTGTTGTLTGLLAAVAAVSLLVGGIGIMNIMLVSVTERTREIGIRLAIGALEHQVLIQFLMEAVVLALFGGIIGIAVGLSLAWLATTALQVPYVLDLGVICLAFGFSAVVGIVFGYFPAQRASRLDPIEALRRE